MTPPPTIKGIFVKSHLDAVKAAKGDEGLRELQRRYGKPLDFKNADDIAVADEIKIIEAGFDIVTDGTVPPGLRSFEAGRMHFRDFSSTPLAHVLLSVFKNPKPIFLNSKYVAEHVFQGITFTSSDLGPNKVKIIMQGGVYPLDHFKGLWWEWIHFSGFAPTVEATQLGPETYEYILSWEGVQQS